MSFGIRYCENCGADLTCNACGGTGRVKKLFSANDLGEWYGGKLHSSNYQSRCRRLFIPLYSEPEYEQCKYCLGLGINIHCYCKGL